eukprot:TRINITY_DN43596_c0_g1_i1.p1 TRINITY_DN43596_c0_g1~~TRINITY_DN43596_c0_g1_i1.p1  ORF type:complete len:870 (+),score=279.44 TRINITY_DN43596_c0_g1_i1:60-2669(+)
MPQLSHADILKLLEQLFVLLSDDPSAPQAVLRQRALLFPSVAGARRSLSAARSRVISNAGNDSARLERIRRTLQSLESVTAPARRSAAASAVEFLHCLRGCRLQMHQPVAAREQRTEQVVRPAAVRASSGSVPRRSDPRSGLSSPTPSAARGGTAAAAVSLVPASRTVPRPASATPSARPSSQPVSTPAAPAAAQQPPASEMAHTQFVEQATYALGGVQVSPETVPLSGAREVLRLCTEAGDRHRAITEHLSTHRQSSLSNEALKAGAWNALSKYDQKVADLHAQVPRGLTIPEVVTEAMKLEPHLYLLDYALQHVASKNAKGGRLLNCLESFKHFPAGKGLFSDLRQAASRPVNHSIVQWLMEGRIDDPYDEFFVQQNPRESRTNDNWWGEKYKLNSFMRPPFVSDELARRILLCGKSVNFLRQLCGVSFRMPVSVQRLLPHGEGDLQPEQLPHLVDAALGAVNRRVLDVLRDQCHLVEHLSAARSFCLLTEGDFFDRVQEDLGWWLQLSHRDEAVARTYAAQSVLEECVRKTPATRRYVNIAAEVPLRVRASLSAPADAPGHLPVAGFFALQYHCEPPLNTVLPKSVTTEKYRPLCALLWRLRTLRHHFVVARADFKSVLRIGVRAHMAKNPPRWWQSVTRVVTDAQVVEHAMLQFLNSVLGYMLIDGVDQLWKDFDVRLQRASCLDEVIGLNQTMLKSLHTHFLLDADMGSFMNAIDCVLRVIEDCVDAAKPLKTLIAALVENFRAGLSTGVPKSISQEHALRLRELGPRLLSLRSRFIAQTAELLLQLDKGLDPHKHGRASAGPLEHMGCLQRLRTVLDFNKFVQNRRRDLWDRDHQQAQSELRGSPSSRSVSAIGHGEAEIAVP